MNEQGGAGTAREAGSLLFRLVRAISTIENRECRCCRLTTGQALALLALKPGKCVPMRRVAESLGVSAGTATRVVDNLVRDGLAKRGSDPSDGRCVCGCPTPKGEARIRQVEKYYETCWRRIFGNIPKVKLSEMIETLESLTSCVEQAGKNAKEERK